MPTAAGVVEGEHVRAGGVAIAELERLGHALLFDDHLDADPADVCVINPEIGPRTCIRK